MMRKYLLKLAQLPVEDYGIVLGVIPPARHAHVLTRRPSVVQ